LTLITLYLLRRIDPLELTLRPLTIFRDSLRSVSFGYFHTLCCFDVGFGAVRYMTIAESKARTDPSPRAAVQPNHMAT
jgi:hypothetical protein